MRRLFPHPMLALALFVMWLLLTQSFSAGQILLGTIAAIIGSRAMGALRQAKPRMRRLGAALKLAGIVLVDILRSNFAVAAVILFPKKDRVSNFVRMPIELESRHGLAVLALIITATPGTIWVEFDRSRSDLLVHVLDLVDEEEWVRLIKRRYEALLMEIFGG